jgi:hypothetical protein
MRRKLRLLAASATLLLVLAAVGLFMYRVGQIHSSGERSSEAEYSILRNALVSLQSKAEIDGELVRGRLLALFQGSDRLLAAQVLDSSGLVLWKVPAESRYFALPNEAQAESGYAAPHFSTMVQTTPLIEGMRLTALYTTFRRSDISKAALPSFIMLLAWFIALAAATFFLRKDAEAGDGQKEPEARTAAAEAESETAKVETADAATIAPVASGDAAEAQPPVPEDLDESLEEDFGEAGIGIETSWLSPTAKKQSSGRNFEESLAKLEEEVREWSSRKASSPPMPPAPQPPATDEADEESVDEEIEEIQEELAEQADMDADEGERPLPEDAFVPEAPEFEAEELLKEFEELSSGGKAPSTPPAPLQTPQPSESGRRDLADLSLPLSLQNPGLEARLSEGLARQGADLALLLIHCGLASDSDPAAAALAVTLRDYIGAADLIFELYKGAFAVVLPSVDLGAALKMSEDLADVLSTTYSLYRDLEGEAPVYLGISARSNRSVDAFKLYREASTAVHKAYAGGPSKILAFRPKAE